MSTFEQFQAWCVARGYEPTPHQMRAAAVLLDNGGGALVFGGRGSGKSWLFALLEEFGNDETRAELT